MKVVEFVPEYETAPDLSEQVAQGAGGVAEMRDYINAYMRNVPKK